MKRLFSVFLISILFFTTQLAFSQKITLKGFIEEYSIKQGDKVYYRENENSYTPNKFIIVHKNKAYTFSYDVFQFKKKNINKISFSKSLEKNGCEHTINCKAIESVLPQMFKNFVIETDLFLTFACEVSDAFGAKEGKDEVFLGDYTLTCADTAKDVSLEDILYRYRSKYKIEGDLYNEEFGSWNYNKKDQVLTIYSWYVFNNSIGLKKVHRKEYQFKVALKNGQLDFTNLQSKQKSKLEKSVSPKLIIKNGNFIPEPPVIKKTQTKLPPDIGFKSVFEDTKWYGHSVVMTPNGEQFLTANLVWMANTGMENKSFTLKEIIKKELDPSHRDATGIYKVIDSSSANHRNWILLSVENSVLGVDRTKPLSYLKYAGSMNNVYFEAQIRIPEKTLSNEFIEKWKSVLLTTQLVDTYADE